MEITTTNGRQLYYEVHHPTKNSTLVFLNGLTQSTVSWALLLPHFRNFRVILLDFVFQGKSDKRGEWQDFDAHADDVAQVLHQEKISTASILGLSYGSLVAQHFAVRYPQQLEKLVLMSSFCHKTPYYEAMESAWWQSLKIGGYPLLLEVMLPTVLSENYFNNPLIPIELMKQARMEANQDTQALFNLMRATKERGDFRPELKKVKAETMVLHGEKDLLFPLHMGEEVAGSIKGARFVVIRGVGHTLNLEGVNEVCSSILSFLSGK